MSEVEARPRSFLSALGVDSVQSLAPVTGGADTEIWRVEHAGMISALRIMRPEQAPVAEIERLAMAAAAPVLPIPEIRATTIWDEQPVMLIEWMPGVPLLHAALTDLKQASTWGRLLGEAQARLHDIPAPSGLPTIAQSWLGELNPEIPASMAEARLLHFDFHPMNVLVENGQVSGVIDWTNASAGDPLFDAARTWAIFECVDITFPGLDKKASRFVLSEFSRGWREAYEARRGPLGQINPILGWALTATSRDLAGISKEKPSTSEVLSTIADGLKATADVLDAFR